MTSRVRCVYGFMDEDVEKLRKTIIDTSGISSKPLEMV